mmetsp:Transcript_129365/g.374627  ORF Transcript_129365/g.374627 Transcript_129365/m.374627 type:complete len:123 (-) Transcript_129365:93-461(-)
MAADPSQALRQPLVESGDSKAPQPSTQQTSSCNACLTVLGAIVAAVLLTGPVGRLLLKPLMIADNFLPEKIVLTVVVVGVLSGVGFLCYANWRIAMLSVLMLFTMACSIVLQATIWADPDNE